MLKKVLTQIAKLSDVEIAEDFEPSTKTQIEIFIKNAQKRQIPQSVTDELISLYKIADSYEAIALIGFHSCDDEILWEWWDDSKEMWLSQRDDTTIRWTNGKFCLGDASNVSFSSEYEYNSLNELLEYCYTEMKDYE